MSQTLAAPASAAPRSINLMPHQTPVIDFLVTRPAAAVWGDIGAGKTLSSLLSLQLTRPTGHILVIAPVAIARSTWINEIEEFGLPIRTKSLIVDERDKALSKEARLQAFHDVLTDPPTMYFINQDLISRPSVKEQVLVRAGTVTSGSELESRVIALADPDRALSRKDLTTAVQESLRDGSGHGPSKQKVTAAITRLVRSGHLLREQRACRQCAGDGCASCRFGLVDQMPVTQVRGPNGHLYPQVTWPFQTVIIDEAQGFRSHSASRFKALARMRPAISRTIELTGTPAPNGLHDLWAQMYLLDGGQALGENITAFRERWFTPKMVPGTNTPAKYLPNPGAEQEIYDAISHLVISVENRSLNLDEPDVRDLSISMPRDAAEAYADFKRELVLDIVDEAAEAQARDAFETWLSQSADDEAAEIRDELAQITDNAERSACRLSHQHRLIEQFAADPDQGIVTTVVAANNAVLASKLTQFASGTLYTADPDDPSTKGRYETIHNAKLEMVEYILRNSGQDPVLLAYSYIAERIELQNRLTRAGFDVQVFDGSRDMVRRWNAQQIPVMLLHPASAGPGLNLQHGGSRIIWFTLPQALDHYQQLNGRLHRTGQKEQVTIYRLITKATYDARTPALLEEKASTQLRLRHAVDPERQAAGNTVEPDAPIQIGLPRRPDLDPDVRALLSELGPEIHRITASAN